MIKQTCLFTFLVILTVGPFSAFAKDGQESVLLLREALMESNADYNVHKGKANMDEFDRADTWVERDTQALLINQDKHFVSNTEEVQKLREIFDQEMSVGQRGLSATEN